MNDNRCSSSRCWMHTVPCQPARKSDLASSRLTLTKCEFTRSNTRPMHNKTPAHASVRRLRTLRISRCCSSQAGKSVSSRGTPFSFDSTKKLDSTMSVPSAVSAASPIPTSIQVVDALVQQHVVLGGPRLSCGDLELEAGVSWAAVSITHKPPCADSARLPSR